MAAIASLEDAAWLDDYYGYLQRKCTAANLSRATPRAACPSHARLHLCGGPCHNPGALQGTSIRYAFMAAFNRAGRPDQTLALWQDMQGVHQVYPERVLVSVMDAYCRLRQRDLAWTLLRTMEAQRQPLAEDVYGCLLEHQLQGAPTPLRARRIVRRKRLTDVLGNMLSCCLAQHASGPRRGAHTTTPYCSASAPTYRP